MRRLLILTLAIGLLTLAPWPALAAHRVTINQLEQTLSSAAAKHRSDPDLARQIGELQLSERLTPQTLQRLASAFSLQPHATLALALLADQSSILDPPQAELPPDAPPDADTQKRMLDSARAYVLESLPRLPNLFATRATVRFDDTPQVLHAGDWPIRAGFHLVGNTSRVVTVRDGNEVTDSPHQAAETEQITGLSSQGEFGPILARTIADIAGGKIQFGHWEKSGPGIIAIFRYSVPRHSSHYQVHFCCVIDREFQGGGQSLRARLAPRNPNVPDKALVDTRGLRAWEAKPAYHGTLAIEPSSGAIVRLTLDAELDPENTISRASTVVEYSRVVIGDQPFVCPVRSLAISSQQGPPLNDESPQRVPIIAINETTFTDYHRLGSSTRILATREAETP